MKNICKNILVIALALCVVMSLAACGSSAPAKAETAAATEAAAGGLERYDYVIVMNGMNLDIVINENLKSLSGEIKSNGLEFSGYCTVEDGILTVGEYVTGNEKVWTGFAAHTYKLNPDGTAEVLD